MTNIAKKIRVFKKYSTIDDIIGIFYSATNEELNELIFLIDYINWNTVDRYIFPFLSNRFADIVLKKYEHLVTDFIIYRNIDFKYFEKYARSKHLDMKRVILYKKQHALNDKMIQYMTEEDIQYRNMLYGN